MEWKTWLTVGALKLAARGVLLALLVLGTLALVPAGPARDACLAGLRGELGAVVDVLSR